MGVAFKNRNEGIDRNMSVFHSQIPRIPVHSKKTPKNTMQPKLGSKLLIFKREPKKEVGDAPFCVTLEH